MANAIYVKYKQSALSGDASTDLLQSTANVAPYCALVATSSYTFSSSHQFYSSLSGVIGTDQQLTTPTATNGTFDADDVTYTAVSSGSAVGALVIYRKNAGANTTWRLVLYEDTGVTGLPVTPNGGNIQVTWNGSGIFTISDRNLKENVKPIGELGPLTIYEFNYADSVNVDDRDGFHVGLMAQEVERVVPSAVALCEIEGRTRKVVNYAEVIDHLQLAA